MADVLVRDMAAGDEARWRELWAGYLAFYEATVADDVTDVTWRRILAREEGMRGRVADCDGAVVGFSVSILHAGTWTIDPSCYLEDLFVAPDVRGRGVGRALIADLIEQGRREGWAKLYWHTRTSNTAARRLYDTFGLADDFVRYRLDLS